MVAAKGSERLYMPELDVLRFVAFCLVFLFHVANIETVRPGEAAHWLLAAKLCLRYAVSLFFLLSAYLITVLLEAEIKRTGHVHVRAFYIRRVARIWPLYFFILLLCTVTGLWLIPDWRLSTGIILSFLFLGGNWWLASAHVLNSPLISMWSVNIEEQFYLLVPLVVGRFRQTGLVVTSVLAIVASFGTLAWMGWHDIHFEIAVRFNSFVEMQFFAAGTLLALLLNRRPWRASVMIRLSLFVVAAASWVASVSFFDVSVGTLKDWPWSPSVGYSLVLAGCIAMFLGFLGMHIGPAFRPLVWLGKLSYGLYAYHLYVLSVIPRVFPDKDAGELRKLLTHLAAFGLTVLIAWLSYTLLETPFLRLKRRFTYVQNREI